MSQNKGQEKQPFISSKQTMNVNPTSNPTLNRELTFPLSRVTELGGKRTGVWVEMD